MGHVFQCALRRDVIVTIETTFRQNFIDKYFRNLSRTLSHITTGPTRTCNTASTCSLLGVYNIRVNLLVTCKLSGSWKWAG